MTTTLHSSFTLERDYPHPPAHVFAHFADKERKTGWFADPAAGDELVWELDFREGGREINIAPYEGQLFTYEAIYHDIVADQRIVYSYTMVVDGRRLSASLATLAFEATEGGTHLVLTEQGAFLDGNDDPVDRERGTRELLDLLGTALDRAARTARP